MAYCEDTCFAFLLLYFEQWIFQRVEKLWEKEQEWQYFKVERFHSGNTSTHIESETHFIDFRCWNVNYSIFSLSLLFEINISETKSQVWKIVLIYATSSLWFHQRAKALVNLDGLKLWIALSIIVSTEAKRNKNHVWTSGGGGREVPFWARRQLAKYLNGGVHPNLKTKTNIIMCRRETI